MTALETGQRNLVTQSDLHQAETRLRRDFGEDIKASEGRLRAEAQASEERLRKDLGEDIKASEGRLRAEAQASEERLRKAIKASEKRTRLAVREDMRKDMREQTREFRLWLGLILAGLVAISSLPPLWSYLGSLL